MANKDVWESNRPTQTNMELVRYLVGELRIDVHQCNEDLEYTGPMLLIEREVIKPLCRYWRSGE